MDVDQDKIAAAVLVDYDGEPRMERTVKNQPKAIEAFVAKLSSQYDTVMCCYEASGCGFGLYRRVIENGAACMVVAPSSLPRKANDRIKTDRRDARKLAMGLRNDELQPIYVPTRRDEAVRDYLRLYEDVKSDLKKAKQRLLHFLQRHEKRYTEGSTWTGKFWRWLNSLEFAVPMLTETFEEYKNHVSQLEEKRIRIKERVEQIAAEESYAPAVRKLTSFKGIATLTALSLTLEIGDFRRFARAEQFMAFLGLVPSEHSSGARRRVGSITKAGNSHLRKLLVEAAWHARSYPPHSKRLKRARSGVAPDIVRYADRAGRRLTKKYWRLLHANRPRQVAATAVARELAGFVWGAMVGKTA
jgi:transposase